MRNALPGGPSPTRVVMQQIQTELQHLVTAIQHADDETWLGPFSIALIGC